MIRSTTLAAVIACAVATAPSLAGAQPMTYAPGTHRYQVIAELRQRSESPAGTREMTATSTQHLTVTLAPRGDTLDITMVVDSVAFSSVPAIALPVDTARGRTVRGAMSTRGKIHRLAGTDSASNVLAKNLGSFFPQLPEVATTGRSWTDTTVTDAQPGFGAARITVVSTSRLTGDTTVAGVTARKIERVSDGSGGGVQTGAAGEMVMQVKANLRTTFAVGTNGVYMGSSTTSTTNITMTVAAAGLSIPLNQALTSRVLLMDTPGGSR